jgi:hypothetical protein
MPYHYKLLDDIKLPLYNPSQNHDPAPAESWQVRAVGGYYDAFAAEDANGAVNNHTLTGIYWGETTYLVDETGNRFVDETGNPFIFGNGSTMLRSQVAALRAKIRSRCTLWRYWLDDNPAAAVVRDWKKVRFVRMSQPQVTEDRVFKAEISCEFEPVMPHMANWHAETRTDVNAGASNGIPVTFAVENPSETVGDGYFLVARTGGTITAVAISCAELGIGLVWTAPSGLSIGSGQTLVIDDGNDTVSLAGQDAYSGFGLSDHSAKTWLRLPQGLYNFTATVLGGNATVSYRFYPQTK